MAATAIETHRQPQSPPSTAHEPVAKIEGAEEISAAFKSAMRRLAATVTIITARHSGQSFGMAATAVSSVTTAPPSLLTCINQSASIHDPIRESGRFCINLLNCDHLDLVSIFSGKLTGEDRFNNGRWVLNNDSIPYLLDAQASLFCKIASSMTYGSHSIFIGEVDEILICGDTAPLLYQEGAFYRTVSIHSPV